MRIIVSHELCQGHARCMAIGPAVYELDDSGYIVSGTIEVPPGAETQAYRGARACPERALAVADGPVELTWPPIQK